MADFTRRQVLQVATAASVVPVAGATPPTNQPIVTVKFKLFVGKNCWVREGTVLHTAKLVDPYNDIDIYSAGSPSLHFGLRFGHRAQITVPSVNLLEVQIHAVRVDNDLGMGNKKKKRLYKLKTNGDVDSETDKEVLFVETFVYAVYEESDPATSCCVSCGDTTVCGPKGQTCIYCEGQWICC